jgi:hypothetical protein
MQYHPHYGNDDRRRQSKPCGSRENRILNNGPSVISGCFSEYTAQIKIMSGEGFSANYLTKNARAITIFAKNTGESPIVISLQNSPNGLDFSDDPQKLDLIPNETGCLVPYIFSKYTRVTAKSAQTGAARIWFQMQNHSYCQYPD